MFPSLSRCWITQSPVYKFNTSESLTDFYLNKFVDSVHGKVFAAVEFHNFSSEHFSFCLRFPGVPRHFETAPIRLSWETVHVMPELSPPGPRERANDGGKPGYQREGFLLLQHHLSMAAAKVILGNESELQNEVENRTHFLVRQFPFPPYVFDVYLFALSILFPAIVVFSFIYPAVNLSKSLVVEKEKRLKESMKMMGLHEKYHWIAYWVKAFVWALPSTVVIVTLLTLELKTDLALLNFSSPTVIFAFFIVYEVQNICLCFAISSFFSKANLAGIATGTIFFFTFAPFGTAVQHYGYVLSLSPCLFVARHSIFSLNVCLSATNF